MFSKVEFMKKTFFYLLFLGSMNFFLPEYLYAVEGKYKKRQPQGPLNDNLCSWEGTHAWFYRCGGSSYAHKDILSVFAEAGRATTAIDACDFRVKHENNYVLR